ncbi:hypothetical protein GCM10020229_34410 [Kitasatospora albolonga]|uniref:LAGLIDADG family homing endonuclease n=1 Tax=Kitasatospora albolonga TaxID=68173 RepID=UPI0031E5C121
MNDFDLERPEHAYMFGFLQADGHLHQGPGNKGRLSVELSARDAPLLEEFQRLCPYNSSIRYRTRSTNFAAEHTSVVWTVCAREFRETLQSLGLPPGRKSDTIAPPTAPHSERDYLRGLVDADGSLGRTGRDLPFISLTTKSDAVVAYFLAYAERLTGQRRILNRNARDDIYNICITREDAVTITSDLYHPGCLALPRKLAAAQAVTTWVRPAGVRRNNRRSWTDEETELLLATADPAEAAVLLNRTVQSCQMRRWRVQGPKKARVRFPRPLA